MRLLLPRPEVWKGRSYRSDVSVTAGTNLGAAAIAFCTGIITARFLGPHGRGELAAIVTTPSAIATFAMLGLPEALVYLSAREPKAAGRYLGTAVSLALMSSVPFALVAYLTMPLFLRAQSLSVVTYAREYLLIAPVYATVAMLYNPLRGTGAFLTWNALRLSAPILSLGVLAIAYLTQSITPPFIAFGNLASYAILLLPTAHLVHRRLGGPYSPDLRKASPMLRYAFPCLMTGLPRMLNLRLDQILMPALLSSRDLGLYAVALSWSSAVWPVLTPIGTTLLPLVASTGTPERAANHMSRAVRMTTMLAVTVCVVIAAAAPIAIPLLFGQMFRGSILAALILVPAAGVLGINFSLQEGLRGLGHPYPVLQAELLGLGVTTIGLALMMRPLGIVGAALSSLLGYTTVTIGLLFAAKRVALISISSLILPRQAEMKRSVLFIAALAREMVAPAG